MPEAHLEAAEQLLHEHAMQRIEGALSGIDYHQFYVMTEDEDSDPEYPTVRSNHDLIAPTSGYGFCAFTGIAMGTVHLTIEILDLPPEAIDDTREWEAITELSFLANATAARIQLLMDDTPPPFKTFTLPQAHRPYRTRAHAQGRSLDFDAVVTENVREYHLLQIWPTDELEAPIKYRIDDQWEHQHYEQS